MQRLRSIDIRTRLTDEGLAELPDILSLILEDGASTIYSHDYPFYRTAGSATARSKDTVDVIKDIDYFGGVGGAATGTVVPGVGTAAGAAGASAGAALGALIDWIW